MKKLLSITAIAALMSTAAVSGELNLRAHVKNASLVSFVSDSNGQLTAGTEETSGFETQANSWEIGLGATSSSLFAGAVYLKTNNDDSPVQMTLTYDKMYDEDGGGSNTIDLMCQYANENGASSSTYVERASATPFNLITGAGVATDTNSNAVGSLYITAVNSSDSQIAGNYKGTIAATITSL